MLTPFLCFDDENDRHRALEVNRIWIAAGGRSAEGLHERPIWEGLDDAGELESFVAPAMARAHFCILLVGQGTAFLKNVSLELALACKREMPILAFRVHSLRDPASHHATQPGPNPLDFVCLEDAEGLLTPLSSCVPLHDWRRDKGPVRLAEWMGEAQAALLR